MDFYEQHAYDEDSEAMNELIMKLVVATEQMVELKSMIFAREQTQAMNSYNPWPINEINTYEQLVSPSLKEAFNNIMQSIQQLWDEAATMPSYGFLVMVFPYFCSGLVWVRFVCPPPALLGSCFSGQFPTLFNTQAA
ncbi:hypothetical protein LWI29_000465 [Acer saccharum]|uniref:Uncharacterized protein n=1 Tax=Acer saccharum TaxID=4024 RepID=A0AA39S9C6_ACESA|nr:hypothetical protein LWI29_000465 [Acer saccharum]